MLLSSEVTDVIEIIADEDVLEEVSLRLPAKTITSFQIMSNNGREMIKCKTFNNKDMYHQEN